MSTINNFSSFEVNQNQKTFITGGGERPWVLRNLSATPSQDEINKLISGEQTLDAAPTNFRRSYTEDEVSFEMDLTMDF